MKFNPQYSLSVETTGGANLTIELPYSCEFMIRRQNLASAQTATFKILNLAEKSRDLIYKDAFNLTQLRNIQFRAGYPDIGTPLLFNGTVYTAYSEKPSPGEDFITTIECYDGGYAMANGISQFSVGSGATFKEILMSLNKDLPGIADKPIIGDFATKTRRGSVFLGNTWNYIVQLTQGLANIDNGQLKVLKPNEVINGEIPVINSDTGLKGSPKRSQSSIELSMLFEPRLTVGQLVDLESETNTIFNGVYKVTGFTHTGLISPSVAGQRQTDVTLWKGTEAFTNVPGEPIQ